MLLDVNKRVQGKRGSYNVRVAVDGFRLSDSLFDSDPEFYLVARIVKNKIVGFYELNRDDKIVSVQGNDVALKELVEHYVLH